MAWYNANWTYRVKVTVESSQVTGDQTDFPVYIDLSNMPSGFFTNVDSSGDDIRVTRSDGTTECAFEVVAIDTGSSTGELHFKANSILAASNVDYYIYYGNSGASAYSVTDTYGRNNVWSDYDCVFHFEDSDPSTTITDATGNGFNMTDTGMSSSNDVSGKLGKAIETSGSEYASYTEGSAVVPQTVPITGQIWFNATNNTTNYHLFSFGDSSQNFKFASVQARNNAVIRNIKHTYGGSSTAIINTTGTYSASTWHMVHAKWISSDLVVYLDGGNKVTGSSSSTNAFADHNRIGLGYTMDSTPAFSGNTVDLDEFRLRSDDLSDSWISTEYNNQNDPSSFLTIGSEETNTPSTFKPKVYFFI